MENKTIRDWYYNKKFYDVFMQLISDEPVEVGQRLEVLDNFFLTYVEPKISNFGYDIERFEGESGPDSYWCFKLHSYELFMKENDPELYKIYFEAEKYWSLHNQLNYILKEDKKEGF